MAGITNTAYRRLCREYGGGLFVSEMVTSRALVERTPESMRLIGHHESEDIRSVQLYGVDPKTIANAVTMLVAEDRADHIDLNFGCPVPKVTRKGGGAALPWKSDLFDAIVCAEDYEHGKPAPDPFLEAARRLGVEPWACLVFEDSPTGIAAAKAAGMAWVFVPSAPIPTAPH